MNSGACGGEPRGFARGPGDGIRSAEFGRLIRRLFLTRLAMGLPLARLRGFGGWREANPLIFGGSTPVGLHYTGVAEVACSAVILGGGCAGSVSLSRSSSSVSSGSGCWFVRCR